MANVLITGARGFIGRHLAVWLASEGHVVSGVGHGEWSQPAFEAWGLKHWVNADISAESLARTIQDLDSPELIFHLAGGSSVGMAIADPAEDFLRTVTSTSILLKWMISLAEPARLIAVSSAAVYGAGHDFRINEKARLNPFSPYGEHKLRMEDLCREYATQFGLSVAIPRLFSVYGIELRKQLLWDLCNKLQAKGPIELGGSGDEIRDWTHISDVVRGLSFAAELADEQSPVFNLATGVATPVREIAALLASNWEDGAISRIKFSGQSRQGDPFSLLADTGLMTAQGFESDVAVEKGIAEYVSWFRQSCVNH